MKIKTALKKVIEALGGTSTSKNITGLIDEVSENVGGGIRAINYDTYAP